jgi:hypothetical protein
MKIALLLPFVALALSACHTPEGDAWDRAHHVGEINWTGTPGVISTSPPSQASPFNDKNYADPHPHSDSDDAQRAAYIHHQQDQQREQSQASHDSGMPDLSKMSCTGSSNVSTAANAGMMTSSSSCHN